MQLQLLLIFLFVLVNTNGLRLSDDNENYFSQVLDSNWAFKSTGNVTWLPAKVPGTVHLDLMHNEIIGDPYWRANWLQVQWIEDLNWEYHTTFDVDPIILTQPYIILEFEGLDTHATVILNNKTILNADNMFRTWKVNVTSLLKPFNNTLHIIFESAVNYDNEQAELMLPIVLPADNSRIYSRKAQYHYGWDWGPRLVTCGIWKPIKIKAWNKAIIKDVHVVVMGEVDNEIEVAELIANVTIDARALGDYTISLYDNRTDELYAREDFSVQKTGKSKLTLNFSISNPQLWWCWNIGEPHLYPFRFELSSSSSSREESTVLSEKLINFGIRTIKLIQQKDTNNNGSSFMFRLNGIDIFAKGANYIPPDMFMPRVTYEDYLSIVEDAIEANFNMLRVWGGGNYENDTFYDLCDEKGILLWQEFMFACGMYPGNDSFLENVRVEIKQNVKRLRNHASISIWVGNNENRVGWFNWGWQDNMTNQQAGLVWGWYLDLFDELIPEVLEKQDPTRFYWESSPYYNYDQNLSFIYGDSHFWAVWVEQWNIETYNTYVGRFNTEYGMQGMLSMNSIMKFTLPSDRYYNSTVIQAHERHAAGWYDISYYLETYYPNVNYTFTNYIYMTQTMQTYAIQTAIEAHRRNKPHSMGTLVWQMNDVWPVVSWSMRDYYGDWKGVMYMAKRYYQNVIVSIMNRTNETGLYYDVYVVSEKLEDYEGLFEVDVMDFEGNSYLTYTSNITIPKSSSSIIYTLKDDSYSINTTLIRARLTYDFDEGLSETTYYLGRPLYLDLPIPKLQLRVWGNTNSFELTSNVLAKSVSIYLKGIQAKWSDNYFDLLPNESKNITFHVEKQDSEDSFLGLKKIGIKNLTIMTLAHAIHNLKPNVDLYME